MYLKKVFIITSYTLAPQNLFCLVLIWLQIQIARSFIFFLCSSFGFPLTEQCLFTPNDPFSLLLAIQASLLTHSSFRLREYWIRFQIFSLKLRRKKNLSSSKFEMEKLVHLLVEKLRLRVNFPILFRCPLKSSQFSRMYLKSI